MDKVSQDSLFYLISYFDKIKKDMFNKLINTNKGDYGMVKTIKDPFGFTKAINMNKLKDPKVLKELEKIFLKEEKKSELREAHDLKGTKKLW